MAHELYIPVNGKPAMFYVGKPPWHGLGTMLENPPTSEEAIRAAGLDWEVAKFPLFASFGEEETFRREVNRKALMPLDRINSPLCPVFGVVGDHYGIVQNTEAFNFFDPIVSGGLATYETAGALGEGERVWILARLAGSMLVARGDAVDKYLLLANSHTGMASVQIKLTPVRVVCNNTLTMALSFGHSLKIPHFPDVKQRLAYAGKLIAGILKNYEVVESSFKEMAKVRMSPGRFEAYLNQVMPLPGLPEKPSPALLARKEKIEAYRRVCSDFFAEGHENDPPGVRHTLWTAYNTITFFADHVVSVPRGMDIAGFYERDALNDADRGTLEKRLKRIWFGDASAFKVRGYNAAVALLNAA